MQDYGLQAYYRNTEATESSYFLISKSRTWRKSILSETFAITKCPCRRTARIIYTFFPHYLDQRFLWRVLRTQQVNSEKKLYHATVSNIRGKVLLKWFNRRTFMKKIPPLAMAMYNKLLQILLTCQTTFAVYLNIVRQKSTFNKAGAFSSFSLFQGTPVYWKATEFSIRQRALRKFSNQLT